MTAQGKDALSAFSEKYTGELADKPAAKKELLSRLPMYPLITCCAQVKGVKGKKTNNVLPPAVPCSACPFCIPQIEAYCKASGMTNTQLFSCPTCNGLLVRDGDTLVDGKPKQNVSQINYKCGCTQCQNFDIIVTCNCGYVLCPAPCDTKK